MEQIRDLKLALASASMPGLVRRVIPERAELGPGDVRHIVIEPREDFFLDKLVLMPPGEDFTCLMVESLRVGKKQLLMGPTPAVLFSRENVYPMPDAPPPKDPTADLKELFLGWWNVMNERPARYGLNDGDDAEADERDAPPGMTLGGVHARPDESIEIDVRNVGAEAVLLGLVVVGTAQQRSVLT